jgi:hypothetical protein
LNFANRYDEYGRSLIASLRLDTDANDREARQFD